MSPETQALSERTARLAKRIDRQGVETRAVAREAEVVRQSNHFGPALIAAFMTPRNR